MAKTGEDILKQAVTDAQSEANPNQVIEIGMIIGLVTAIFEIIKACRDPETAGAHIQRGSAIAEGQMRRALKREGYEGNVRTMAAKLVAQGTKATPEDIQKVLEEAQDVPSPPGLWPTMGLAIAMLFAGSATALADESTEASGLWPQISVDVSEIKTKVNDLDERTLKMQSDLARLVNVLEGDDNAEPTPVPQVQRPAVAVVAPASSGITYRGVPINVNDWLTRYRNVTRYEINGSVDAHMRWHGFGGNLASLSRQTKIALHSAAHAGASATARTVSRSAAASLPLASDCANGNCAYPARTYSYGSTYGMKQGLFGNWRPIRR